MYLQFCFIFFKVSSYSVMEITYLLMSKDNYFLMAATSNAIIVTSCSFITFLP